MTRYRETKLSFQDDGGLGIDNVHTHWVLCDTLIDPEGLTDLLRV